MDKRLLLCGLAASALLAAGSAHADFIIGGSVYAPEDESVAVVEFLGRDAEYSGDLYFLGWGDEDSVSEAAEDTGFPGLGQWLFNNQLSEIGGIMMLDGMFMGGQVLHFAYKIIDPPEGQDLFRTDNPADAEQFAWDPEQGRLHVEDLRMPETDGDYNDAMFRITFQPVPGPSPIGLLAVGGVIGRRRRRG
jgi:hypothetical protein